MLGNATTSNKVIYVCTLQLYVHICYMGLHMYMVHIHIWWNKHANNKLHDYMKFHSACCFSLFVLSAVIELAVSPPKKKLSPNPIWLTVRVCVCVCGTYNALLVEAAEIARGWGGLPVMLALHRILRPVGHNANRSTGIARRGRASVLKMFKIGVEKVSILYI